MNVSHNASARWSAYTALTQLRTDHAQLIADLATEASPQVIAADQANVEASRRQWAMRSAHRVDVTV